MSDRYIARFFRLTDMESALRMPMVRVIIPFALGILLALRLDQSGPEGHAMYFLFFFVFLIRILPFGLPWKLRWIEGLLIYVVIVLSGYHLTAKRSFQERSSSFVQGISQEKKSLLILEILSDPEKRNSAWRANGRLVGVVDSAGHCREAGLPCLLYLKPDSNSAVPETGDRLLVSALPELIPPPANPGEFDFRNYMAGKNVFLRMYVDRYRQVPGQEQSRWTLYGFAAECRGHIYDKLQFAGVRGNEFDLAASLMLGQKDGLEKDLRDSFSAAGAMHVLCVSGLHVGIIFMVLNLIFKGFQSVKHGKYLRFALILAAMWFYALLTGLSPSVCRACLMFSFLQTGKLMNNPPPTTNTLACSALVLLLIEPRVIMNIGFQLSYLAVLAIVHLTPPMQSLWKPRNSIFRYTWSLLLVSLAAQAGTAPITMHYFHQFPVWFLLTNMMVIPLASVIIYLALSVVLLPFNPLTPLMGELLSLSLKGMSESVRWVERLPGSVISGISITAATTLLLYAILLLVTITLIRKSKTALALSLATVSVLLGISLFRQTEVAGTSELTVYKVTRATVIDLTDGRKGVTFFYPDSIPAETINYSVAPNRIESGIRQLEWISLDSNAHLPERNLVKSGGLIFYNGFRLFVANRKIGQLPAGDTFRVDVVLLTKDFDGTVSGLQSFLSFQEVVIDGSVPRWKEAKYLIECRALGVKCHTVASDGCYTRDISRISG